MLAVCGAPRWRPCGGTAPGGRLGGCRPGLETSPLGGVDRFVGMFADCADTLFLAQELMRQSAVKQAETFRITGVISGDAMEEQR
jgi:hypothetical protein